MVDILTLTVRLVSAMKYQPKRLRRLERVWLGNGYPTYFITICTANRRPVLANPTVHKRLRDFLHATLAHHDWWAGRYVIMPDHLHLLATPGLNAVTLGQWIKALKAVVGDRQIKWQPGCFDHVLRSDESESEKWEYILQNPVRAGLVTDAKAWPYSGEIGWRQGGEIPGLSRQETPPTTERTPPAAHAARQTRRTRPPNPRRVGRRGLQPERHRPPQKTRQARPLPPPL
jgi:REP element-mobilizing transposase RayT